MRKDRYLRVPIGAAIGIPLGAYVLGCLETTTWSHLRATVDGLELVGLLSCLTAAVGFLLVGTILLFHLQWRSALSCWLVTASTIAAPFLAPLYHALDYAHFYSGYPFYESAVYASKNGKGPTIHWFYFRNATEVACIFDRYIYLVFDSADELPLPPKQWSTAWISRTVEATSSVPKLDTSVPMPYQIDHLVGHWYLAHLALKC